MRRKRVRQIIALEVVLIFGLLVSASKGSPDAVQTLLITGLIVCMFLLFQEMRKGD